MSDFKIKPDPRFAYDREAEKNGVRLVFEPHSDPELAKFGERWMQVARVGGSNHAYETALIAARKPYKYLFDRNEAPPELRRSTTMQAIAHGCVRGLHWPDANGDALPFVPDAVMAVFEGEEFIFDKVLEFAVTEQNYTMSARQEALDSAKNT